MFKTRFGAEAQTDFHRVDRMAVLTAVFNLLEEMKVREHAILAIASSKLLILSSLSSTFVSVSFFVLAYVSIYDSLIITKYTTNQ